MYLLLSFNVEFTAGPRDRLEHYTARVDGRGPMPRGPGRGGRPYGYRHGIPDMAYGMDPDVGWTRLRHVDVRTC